MHHQVLSYNLRKFLSYCVAVTLIISQLIPGSASPTYQSPDEINAIDTAVEMQLTNLIHTPVLDQVDTIKFGNKVLLQPYYWDMPDAGNLWSSLADLVTQFEAEGFDSLWIPPMSKTGPGHPASGGYEPYDYYDLGEFDQQGTVETRYGSTEELKSLISKANANGIGVIADVVINHRVWGEPEFNPYTNTITNTDFTGVASGLLKMNYSHFWPNAYGTADSGPYGHFPDVSHAHPYVQEELIKWGHWLNEEIGFDGWRFDSSQLFAPYMVQYWMQNITQTWGVSEYWLEDPDRDVLVQYMGNTNNTVNTFDFPLLKHHLMQMANNGESYDMRTLPFGGLSGIAPEKAVTFAVNHDTYRDKRFNIQQNRHLAYAYILTHPGYPSVFWMDYVNLDLRKHILGLVKIHNQFAKGDISILHTDEDVYVAQREDETGLIIAINDHPNEASQVTVKTRWIETQLEELLGQDSSLTTSSDGSVTLSVQPANFVVYGPGEPVADLNFIKSNGDPETPAAIPFETMDIGGFFDWGAPVYMDQPNDGKNIHTDLTNLYLSQDAENLYVGIGYYQLFAWAGSKVEQGEQGTVEIGIAVDTKSGGATEDPGVNPLVKWGGSTDRPDQLYYISTSYDDNYLLDIDKITKYEYADQWSTGQVVNYPTAESDFLGLLEVSIPLSELDLQEGELGIKIFSSHSKINYATDSIPHDVGLDTSGLDTSWLFMEPPLKIDYKMSESDQSKGLWSRGFYLLVLVVLVTTGLKRRRKSWYF